MSDEEIDEVPDTEDFDDDFMLQHKDATFVVESPVNDYYWSWECDPKDLEKKDEVNKVSKAVRRQDIIAHYDFQRNRALAKLEEEDSDDEWFVANPLANQKKEESEAGKRRGKKRKNDDY